MFDVSLFFVLQNIFILMIVFWVLSWLGERFYKQKNYKSSDEIYECGFSSTHALRVSVNLSFFVVALLLILYDIEFLFLIPALFNFSDLNACGVATYTGFLTLVALSFAFDWASSALKWVN